MNTADVKISRGEVFYITSLNNTVGSEQRSGRPAVIVSNNSNNEHSRCVEIVYLTLQEKTPLPTHVKIDKGVCINSTVLCEQITSVSVDRLGDFMCRLPDEIMDKIDVCLVTSLDLGYMLDKTGTAPIDNCATNSEYVAELVKTQQKCAELKTQVDCMRQKSYEMTQKAEMYEKMYNDLLDKLVRR